MTAMGKSRSTDQNYLFESTLSVSVPFIGHERPMQMMIILDLRVLENNAYNAVIS